MAPGALTLRRLPGCAEPLRGQVLRAGPKCQPCSSALLLRAGCVFWVCDEPPRPLGVVFPSLETVEIPVSPALFYAAPL